MAENKTKPTEVSVVRYLSAITDEVRRKDCERLSKLMTKALNEPPKMWGPSIVGFGSYYYKYESGREGDSCVVGFSSRKNDLTLYLVADYPGRKELLQKLGKYSLGKGCLYIKKLSEVDETVLEEMIVRSAAQRKKNHG